MQKNKKGSIGKRMSEKGEKEKNRKTTWREKRERGVLRETE